MQGEPDARTVVDCKARRGIPRDVFAGIRRVRQCRHRWRVREQERGSIGIGLLGIALAFGLAVLVGAFAFGHVSGGHFNPAVSIGLAIAKRFDWKSVLPYVITQFIAATVAGALLLTIASGKPGFSAVQSGFCHQRLW